MTARIIDGKAVARKLRAEYATRVEALKSGYGVQPGIAVVLVGDNPASQYREAATGDSITSQYR